MLLVGIQFDSRRGLAFPTGTPGLGRYLRTEFLDTPSSRAIPRMDIPSPLISYISFTFPPPSNVCCTSCRLTDEDARSFGVGQFQPGATVVAQRFRPC